MNKLFLPLTLVLGGALAGCSNASSEYTFGDELRLSIERGPEGVSLVEVAVGPARHACRRTKVALALKGMAPTALLTTRREQACRV